MLIFKLLSGFHRESPGPVGCGLSCLLAETTATKIPQFLNSKEPISSNFNNFTVIFQLTSTFSCCGRFAQSWGTGSNSSHHRGHVVSRRVCSKSLVIQACSLSF